MGNAGSTSSTVFPAIAHVQWFIHWHCASASLQSAAMVFAVNHIQVLIAHGNVSPGAEKSGLRRMFRQPIDYQSLTFLS